VRLVEAHSFTYLAHSQSQPTHSYNTSHLLILLTAEPVIHEFVVQDGGPFLIASLAILAASVDRPRSFWRESYQDQVLRVYASRKVIIYLETWGLTRGPAPTSISAGIKEGLYRLGEPTGLLL
jgi:hypothetical protein